MEKSVEFEIADYIKEVLEMKEVEPEGYSPLTLAYIGDSIYDLVIKTKVISEGNKQVKKLHQETSSMVQASAQSEMMRVLQSLLTEEEHAVYRRGRNAKSVSPAKNQSLTDYRRATGDKVEISEATFIGCSADVLLFFAYGRQNFRFL